MAAGISPKHIKTFNLDNTDFKKTYVTAIHTAKKLGWNIGVCSKNVFLSYTKFSLSSFGEEVKIQITEEGLKIKSECTGTQMIDWGKNRRNIEKFISTYIEIKDQLSSEEIEHEYNILEETFDTESDEIKEEHMPLSRKESINDFLAIFKPTKGYTVTPILVLLNILMFIIMVSSGTHILSPEIDDLIFWGANFRPVTLNEEWWRLISSCFIHIGLLHLLFNMFALIYIGLLLEPYLGKVRFITAYFLSGIAGSAVSIYWNELTVSAGASGAIFGMYGVFLAMLTTNLINKTARKALLVSVLAFVGFNLLNGAKDGIDNAAHIGGLLTGLIIGYSFYPSLKNPNNKELKGIIIGSLTSVISIFIFLILTLTPTNSEKYQPGPYHIAKYEKAMEEFAITETMALEVYDIMRYGSDEQILHEIETRGIYFWNENINLLNKVDKYYIPDELHEQVKMLKKYCKIRIKMYEVIAENIKTNSEKFPEELNEYANQIENILKTLNQQNN